MAEGDVKNAKFDSMHQGKKCRVLNSHKVWRKIQYLNGKIENVLYNEISKWKPKRK